MWEITQEFQVPVLPGLHDTQEDTEMEDVAAESKSQEHDNTNETIKTNDTHGDVQNSDSHDQPSAEPYSLREWFYDLTDTDGEPLIHAVYPTADSSKIIILCEKQKSIKVLHLLHNIVQVAGIDFSDEAMSVYFGPGRNNPQVHNHPRETAQTKAYSTHLTTYVTPGNPQDVSQPQQHVQDPPRNAKRTRDGDIRAMNTTSTYVSAAAGATSSSNFGANVDDLLTRLENNMKNVENVDQKKNQDQTIASFESRFTDIENGLSGHGKILTSLATTQERQGALMTSLNEKMDDLTELITGTKPQDTITNELNVMNDLAKQTQTSNPSHGAPKGKSS